MDLYAEQPAIGVDHRVPLAAQHLLARVITARAAGFGGLDALAVDDSSGRACLAPGPLAVPHHQVVRGGR